MSKKLIGGLAVAAALCMAVPALANDGYNHGRGHGYSNGHGNGYGHGKHGYRQDVPRHRFRERVVVREYWRPAPVYQQAVYPAYPAPAPAPGIQIVLPDIFIPFR